MFHYLIKLLPNGKVLLRNSKLQESKVFRASEIPAVIEQLLEKHIEEEDKKDDKVAEIRKKAAEQLKGSNEKK